MIQLSNDREAVELVYDSSVVQGDTISVKATNPDIDGGDPSTRDGLKNDGRFAWTYPKGYAGNSDFVVTGSDGGEDSGTVAVYFS